MSGASEIPLFEKCWTNLTSLEAREGTVSGGQFYWGGSLLKSNASAQRYPYSGWKSECKCKGKRVLNCETHKSSRDESRS